MKFTLGWLKEHLDTSSDLKTIANTLTNIGLEIESLDDGTLFSAFKNRTSLNSESD